MTKQNYKEFLEKAEYSETESEMQHKRKIDNKSMMIIALSLVCALMIAGYLYMKNNFNYLLDLKNEQLSMKDQQINELRESAYDITGQSWKARYNQMDKQFHNVVEYMKSMGYEIDFKYIEGTE